VAYRTESAKAAEPDLASGRSALVECRQSRADFLNHSFVEASGSVELAALEHRKRRMESQLGAHHPDLRGGETLFQEFDTFDLSNLQHEGYQRIRWEILRLRRGLESRSKFARMTRYRSANLCYLVARSEVCADHEVPEGWGLLLWDGKTSVAVGEESDLDPTPQLEL